MNSSGHNRHKQLALDISRHYEQISKEFSNFQTNSGLSCVPGCGKCCFKPDIFCSPLELLPLAMELLERGEAQHFYEKCEGKAQERCIFLHVTDEKNFKAQCQEYRHRPLVCRTFGVSARHGKDNRPDFSVCKTLKEEKASAYEELLNKRFLIEDTSLPYIDLCKGRLLSLDPAFLEEEMPINQALRVILERVLFYAEFESLSRP